MAKFLRSADRGNVTLLRADGGIENLVSEDTGGGGPANFALDTFVITVPEGPTPTLTLSQLPASPSTLLAFLNGVMYDATEYTVVGTAFHWLGNLFTLQSGDVLDVYYSF